jgi:cell division protein FtsB
MSNTAPQLRSRLPRIAEIAVQRARLTVVPRPRTRPRAPRVPFVTLVSVILLAGVIGLLMFNTSMQQASFRATALERQAADLTAQEEALRMELQALRDPQRIAAQAQSRGMVLPGPAGVLDLDTGEILGDPQPALPDVRLPMNPPGPKRPASLDPATIEVKAGDHAASSMVVGRTYGWGDRNGGRNGAADRDRRR